MPDDLTLIEQYAYQAMRNLYAGYKRGTVSKDQAAVEKSLILGRMKRSLEQETLQQRSAEHTATMWKSIEAAANRYGTERTLENADAFVNAVYGAKLKKGTET